ncbi:M48 family metalloprotease [Spirulina subsalsa FACHB-351]|uniref:M48 family metalloprotease n=1 Tax=Spirulina subsalsa FACHB-351 TaxID=234711 RepID=A0ABT3LB01_9CYAN|nr:M48 family metallopeptidase [Spirulina subsalsa]MCW6038292.1 M48 family metalloprotease [Spirulina subsalsa FACHB-351]
MKFVFHAGLIVCSSCFSGVVLAEVPPPLEIITEAEIQEVPQRTFELSPEEQARYDVLREADALFRAGNHARARELYQSVKSPFTRENQPLVAREEGFMDPGLLSPAGGVFWRQYQQGVSQDLDSKVLVPLQLLVEREPGFVLGHLHYAKRLKERGHNQRAQEILQQALARFPNHLELTEMAIQTYEAGENWLGASFLARQFALMNPEHPAQEGFLRRADENFRRYQHQLQQQITGGAIANVLTGSLSLLATGNIFGSLSTVETTALLLRGESAVGDRMARQILSQAPLITDPEVVAYVQDIGEKLVQVSGRNDFNYQFHILQDETINAFALPGGQIFIHAGALLAAQSEAELAGLLAHELSHTILSHGFQLMTQGQVTANLMRQIPWVGRTATNLMVFRYSRDMERQADRVGTRLLAASGYAADGLRNLLLRLEQENKPSPPPWLSTHPETRERVADLERFIVQHNLNRYSYEGVERHLEIRKRVFDLLESNQNP